MNKKKVGGFLGAILAAIAAWFAANQNPTPNPNPSPSPTIIASPSPTSNPSPQPTSSPKPPTGNACPATCPADAKTMNSKVANYNPSTGKKVLDSTPRCGDKGNDAGYCGIVTGDPSITHCKANPEGSGLTTCDVQWLGLNCPLWLASVNNGVTWFRALPDGIDENGNPREGGTPISIDHLDGWSESDGIYTGNCEKANFGLHAPITGFGGVPHGLGLIKACDRDKQVCSDPIDINY